MSIYSMDNDALQGLANIFSATRPSVGRTVRVFRRLDTKCPRKHDGKIGVVAWHGRDKFCNPYRYGDSATHFAMDCMGAWGFRVRLIPADGSEPFFVPASAVIVCCE